MEEILLEKPGKKIILLGNEAIVRGALEAGVDFVSTYPGTPASEIGDTFWKIQNQKSKIQDKKVNFYFEYSINEKVALEAGIGASFSGLKTLVAMKDFGLNVCLEALGPFCYTGTIGSTVIVVADDPSCHSSAQWEENTRALSYLTHLPTLEPSDPQECKDFVKLAFEISEKFKIPVLIRTTTRVAHQRMPVVLSKIQKSKIKKGKFEKDPQKFVTLPPRVLEMKKELLEKIRKIREFSEKSEINIIQSSKFKVQSSKLGIITSGISYLYVLEALKEFDLKIPILKLGFFYPLPERKIKKFIKSLEKVLIVEELDPHLEREIERLAKEANPNLKIYGKDLIPKVGELKPENVLEAISKLTNKKWKIGNSSEIGNWKLEIPKRFPQLCPGCPYWFVFSAIKKAVDPQKVIFGGDIGCYMLAGLAPHFLQDYLSCMGSSLGIAHGIKKSTEQKLITLIGDSTFFHAGLPALINIVRNQSNPLIIVMDNQTTAMTGHQPHPGIKINENPTIKIEDLVKASKIKNLKIIDPANLEELTKTIREYLNKKEASVIIARRKCARLK
jgi:indolepyruvate ferredoxin oxidoreductase alpha subunit